MLSRGAPTKSRVELLPVRCVALFGACGAEAALWAAGAVAASIAVAGEARERPVIAVERGRLVAQLRVLARARRVATRLVTSVPDVAYDAREERVLISGVPAVAAVDATGRTAAWSRPAARRNIQVADVYGIRGALPAGGRVTAPDGPWAYASSDGQTATLALMGIGRPLSMLSVRTASTALGVDPQSVSLLGRVPAWAQSSALAARLGRIAVGDAAVAHDPLSGRGMAFALTTAVAASAVISAWAEGDVAPESALDYYAGLLSAEAGFSETAAVRATAVRVPSKAAAPLPDCVRFVAVVQASPVLEDGRIVVADVLRLADGSFARRVGPLDLLLLRPERPGISRVDDLLTLLARTGLSPGQSADALRWALEHGILNASASG